MAETKLIQNLVNPTDGKNFSMYISVNSAYYSFLELPAQAVMPAISYDAFFDERRFKFNTILKHAAPQNVDPALRADDALTDDFFQERYEWFSRTGEDEGFNFGDHVEYNDTVLPAEISVSSDGTIGFSNGRHRTRAMYSFGIKDIPLLVMDDVQKLTDRVEKIQTRIQKNKTLFSTPDVIKDFLHLPKAQNKDQFKENAAMFLKFATAKKPEDMFLTKEDFSVFKK